MKNEPEPNVFALPKLLDKDAERKRLKSISDRMVQAEIIAEKEVRLKKVYEEIGGDKTNET